MLRIFTIVGFISALVAFYSCTQTSDKVPKVAICGIAIESSTFSPAQSTMDVFRVSKGKEILNNYSEDQLEELPAYTMECGTEDPLVFSSNESFDTFLNEKQIAHTYIKRTGIHDWNFWMACLPKALVFVSQNFD